MGFVFAPAFDNKLIVQSFDGMRKEQPLMTALHINDIGTKCICVRRMEINIQCILQLQIIKTLLGI